MGFLRKLRGVPAAVVMLSCLPTAPCACPPATTLFNVFGEVLRVDGQAIGGALVRSTVWRDSDCGAADPEFTTDPVLSDSAGAFRLMVRSNYAPGPRCLRIVAHCGADSVVIPELIVDFRIDREPPDSLGLLIRFP